jgi:hypothetical protein
MIGMRSHLSAATLAVLLAACGSNTGGNSLVPGGTGGTGGGPVSDSDGGGGSDLADLGDGDRAPTDSTTAGGNDALADVSAGSLPRPMVWTLEPTGPHELIGALGGSSATDVWFVDEGDAFRSTGDGTWTRTTFPGPRVNGIWVAAPDNAYVSVQSNAVYHWNGNGWDHPVVAIGISLEGVWGSGPNDIYAVPGPYRSKGFGVWELDPTTKMSIGGFAVWGSGPTDVWVLDGHRGVSHSKGDGNWEFQELPPLKFANPLAVWGSGPTDIFALDRGEVDHSTGDGKWLRQSLGTTDADSTTSIWGSGPTDIYVGMHDETILRSIGDGKWYRERVIPMVAGKSYSVTAIWGTTADNVYVVTDAGTFRGHPK